MKKAISLLLALVMCLSLCACDKEKVNTQEQTEAIQQTTLPFETEDMIFETETEATELLEVTAPVIEDHPMLSYVYGTWIGDLTGNKPGDPETVPFEQITFNEDGTCIMDDMTGTWGTSTQGDGENLRLDIYVDSELLCTAELRSETYIRFIGRKNDPGVLLTGWFAPQE